MLRALIRISAFVVLACVLGSCATFGLHQTARTTPEGKWDFGGAVTPIFVPLLPETDAYSYPSPLSFGYYPIPELHARVGLSNNSDLGFRWMFGPGMGMDYKSQLASGKVDVAALLGGSFYGLFLVGSGVGVYSLYPRLIVSHEDKPGMPWAFNAGIDYLGAFTTDTYGGGSGGGILSLRAGLGLPFRVNETVRIMPELSVNLPLTAGSDGYSSGIPFGTGLMTLGVSIGSVAKKPAPPVSP